MSNLFSIGTIVLVVGTIWCVLMSVFVVHKKRDIAPLDVNGDVGVSDKDYEVHVFDIKVSNFLLYQFVIVSFFESTQP